MYIHMLDMQDEMEQLGVDWEGPIHEETNETVSVPEILCPLRNADLEELLVAIPPLSQSMQYGLDLYERTLQFASNKLGTL